MYLIFMNILPLLLEPVRQAVMAFQQSLYGVPIKWEPSGHTVTWGECSWGARALGFFLTRKGVVGSLSELQGAEWLSWVPVHSGMDTPANGGCPVSGGSSGNVICLRNFLFSYWPRGSRRAGRPIMVWEWPKMIWFE